MSISRREELQALRQRLRHYPVVAILGARQVGKTTLARDIARTYKDTHHFDLEDPRDLARLSEPMMSLAPLKGLVIIDEIQRMPRLFEVLRVLADRRPTRARFLILGSASLALIKGVSESLAGRISFLDLSGFSIAEVGASKLDQLWWRGGFPRSFLSRSDAASAQWRADFVRTFLERDIPELGLSVPSTTLRRFWTMVAHYSGQVWNAAEFARSLGSAEATARRYLDILTGTFVVRQLLPWHENLSKRQVKSPKIYVRDTGLLHTLLGVESRRALEGHPRVGASWEGFIIEQILAQQSDSQAYFWATHAGAELDLLLLTKGRRIGFEIKYTDAPNMTRSMHTALSDLHLAHLYVVHAGKDSYPLHAKVTTLPATALADRPA